jgi:hypothetical protein
MEGTLVFNGQSRLMKLFIKGAAEFGKPDGLLHEIACHDVGIADGYPGDPYGHNHRCPPGIGYVVGAPMPCATRLPDGSVHINNSDDPGYGCWFSPLSDDPNHNFEQHDRGGIGIHGGGTASPDPFALEQGWFDTLGCLRLQNKDNEQILVPFINFVHGHGGKVTLNVYWP